MRSFQQTNTQKTSQAVLIKEELLALYDQYGSMAYGVILSIIPEPELAQAVLVDLFASLQVVSDNQEPSAIEIIRLARIKALDAKPRYIRQVSVPLLVANDTIDTAKLVFDLSFCQGYNIDAVAEKLDLSPKNVLNVLYTYFKHLRSS